MNKALLLFSLAIFPLFGNAVEIIDQSGLELLTPSLAERSTRKIRLSNELEVYLISDPTTTTSAAAIAVGVGSGDDLNTRPGIAHFVEHLLFMGNEKYQDEEDFSLFLDRFDGKKNACTMTDRTVYMFSCLNEGFFEGLDHLAHFFQNPLFTPSALKRECKAVHQEFARNSTTDNWRLHYLKKHLTNENHSFHRFCIGNLDTLSDLKPAEIRNWYDQHYSANNMKLCVYSNQSLDKLEEVVVSCFSSIENKHWERKKTEESLAPHSSICFVSPMQDQNCLEISWPVYFDPQKRLETHSDHFISHILGHEGKESLLSKLKQEKLAYKIECGLQKINQNQAYFEISTYLTQKGVQEYEKVISNIYEAINGLKKEGYSRHLYDEVQAMGKLSYEYQTRSNLFDFVFKQAVQLIDEPLASYPRKTLIPTSFEPAAFQELLTAFTPEKGIYLLLADPHLTNVAPTKEERWFKVPFSEQKIGEGILKATDKTLSVHPSPNPFIPLKLDRKSSQVSDKLFSIDKECKEPRGHLYSVKDHTFFTPEVVWNLHLKSAAINPYSVKHQVFTELFVSACEEHLNEKFYAAKLASLPFSLSPEIDGFSLHVNGFEEKASLLLEDLTDEITQFRFTPETLAFTRENLATAYDLKLSSPMDYAQESLQQIIFQNYATCEEKKHVLESITVEEANAFMNNLFQTTYLEMSVFGNSKEDFQDIWHHILNKFSCNPFPYEAHIARKAALFSITQPMSIEKVSKYPAGALILTIDTGTFDHKKRAAQQIFSKALQEPFFDELRTKQQTAYVVQSWDQEIEKHLYNFFATLSTSHDPKDLLARFECFLESFLLNLEEKHLTKERFDDIKQSAILQLRSPQLNFNKTGALAHKLLFEYDGDIEWLKKRENALLSLTYEECLEITHQELGRQNPKRIAVIINGTYPETLFHYEPSTIQNLKEKLQYLGKES